MPLITQEFLRLPFQPDQVAFQSFSVQLADQYLNSDDIELQSKFYELLMVIMSRPVVEKPDYWISLVNNEERSDLYRLYCLRGFFLRHINVGDKLTKIGSIPGTKEWFVEDTVKDMWAGWVSGVPTFEPQPGTEQIQIRLRSDQRYAQTPITLMLNGKDLGKIYTDDGFQIEPLLEILRGNDLDSDIVITGVAIY